MPRRADNKSIVVIYVANAHARTYKRCCAIWKTMFLPGETTDKNLQLELMNIWVTEA